MGQKGHDPKNNIFIVRHNDTEWEWLDAFSLTSNNGWTASFQNLKKKSHLQFYYLMNRLKRITRVLRH